MTTHYAHPFVTTTTNGSKIIMYEYLSYPCPESKQWDVLDQALANNIPKLHESIITTLQDAPEASHLEKLDQPSYDFLALDVMNEATIMNLKKINLVKDINLAQRSSDLVWDLVSFSCHHVEAYNLFPQSIWKK